MNKIDQILEKIKKILIQLNFKETAINGETNYVHGDLYCIPQYVQSLGFLVEYANSYEEAQKHWHEDGDAFSMDMGEKAILTGLKEEILKSIGNNT